MLRKLGIGILCLLSVLLVVGAITGGGQEQGMTISTPEPGPKPTPPLEQGK